MSSPQSRRSELMRAVYLKITPGTICATPTSLTFQCAIGDKAIVSGITGEAVSDLIELHNLHLNDGNSFTALLDGIEHIVNRKFSAGRVERNGELFIRKVDVLRYGYRSVDDSAA